jgi:hypothetical protein
VIVILAKRAHRATRSRFSAIAQATSSRHADDGLTPERRRIHMLDTIRKTALVVGAFAACALGGAALAGAADSGSSTATATTTTAAKGAARPPRQPLASDVAAKVAAAAKAKVPGATVVRTEAGGPYATAYHAHVRKSDGTLQVVLVNASFEATAVQVDRGGRGPGGPGGPGGNETPLTGDTKAKVEAAVLVRYPDATIVRTETNADSTAPYESHVTTSSGQELEVLVSAEFAIVDAREHGPRG